MKRESAERLARTLLETEEQSPTFEVGFFSLEDAMLVAQALSELGCAVSFEDPTKPFLIIDQAVVGTDKERQG